MSSSVTAETIEMPGAVVVKIAGEIKTDISELDRQFLRLLASRPSVVVLDLSGLSFCSSLGMGSFMAIRRDLTRRGGKVKLVGLQPMVLESFTRACLLPMFELHDTVEAALA
jgi:anti-sigma B factor antagonist